MRLAVLGEFLGYAFSMSDGPFSVSDGDRVA
jgi:hypothetical protein